MVSPAVANRTMFREASTPRPDWREKCESVGFTFHTLEDIPYWDESARYRFTLNQINNDVEAGTRELLAMCYAAVSDIVGDEQALTRLAVPQDFWSAIAESWHLQDRDLYGRFDLAYDGRTPVKLMEFNADTPTALLESAVVQWQWFEDLRAAGRLASTSDQYNSIHERLIAAFGNMDIDRRLHLAAMGGIEEDEGTILYLADCAAQGGLEAVPMAVEQIGVDAKGFFTDLDNRVIRTLFKLYPWEWMARDAFGRSTRTRSCKFIEPMWKMLLSNKGLCAELWRLHPGHPNLLPSVYEGEAGAADLGADVVRKPLFGREGANIEIRHGADIVAASDGPYQGAALLQALAPVFTDCGRTAIIGSWVVAGEACGLCVREEDGRITTNRARFIPHYISG
jgi:glutathionylspermidine synthase